MDALRYPIGHFKFNPDYTKDEMLKAIEDLGDLPSHVMEILSTHSEMNLDAQYRTDSWTIAQVIHHLADSHLNAYTRIKLILTEDTPTIRPYDENAWSRVVDARSHNLEPSLSILSGIHERMYEALKETTPEDWKRQGYHPEHKRSMGLDQFIFNYQWHGKHHLAHIELAMNGEGD